MILALLPGPIKFQAVRSMREFDDARIFERGSLNYMAISQYMFHGVPVIYFAYYENDNDIKMHVEEFNKIIHSFAATDGFRASQSRILTKDFDNRQIVMLLDYMETINAVPRLYLSAPDPNSVNPNSNQLT